MNKITRNVFLASLAEDIEWIFIELYFILFIHLKRNLKMKHLVLHFY